MPLNPECSSVEGYLPAFTTTASAEQHWIRLTGISPSGSLQDAHLELEQATRDLLGPQMELVDLRLRQSSGLPSFLVELRNLLTQATAAPTAAIFLRTPTFFRTIKQDLDTIKWERVLNLAKDCASLTLRCVDAADRFHDLSLTIPPDFPATAPRATADLPIAFTPRWGPNSSLNDVTI